LLLLIVRLIQDARQIDGISALLLMPYALWVTFAAALNWTLWQLNPASLAF
jgi:tryptophan-rich sensory protein